MIALSTAPTAWYCWQTLPKKEHLAARYLRAQAGLSCLAPRLAYVKKTRRGRVRFVEALFPGYVFIELEPARHYRQVMASPGIRRLVTYGDQLAPVPLAFVAALQERGEIDEPIEVAEPPLETGTPVVITEGPFENWEAVVTGLLPAKDRVRILLEFLGREMALEMRPEELLRRDRQPKEAVLKASPASSRAPD